MKVYCEDCDNSYDVQKDDYDIGVDTDIQNIDNEYNLYDLLRSISDRSGVKADDIRSIKIRSGRVEIFKKGKKPLVLPLAA